MLYLIFALAVSGLGFLVYVKPNKDIQIVMIFVLIIYLGLTTGGAWQRQAKKLPWMLWITWVIPGFIWATAITLFYGLFTWTLLTIEFIFVLLVVVSGSALRLRFIKEPLPGEPGFWRSQLKSVKGGKGVNNVD